MSVRTKIDKLRPSRLTTAAGGGGGDDCAERRSGCGFHWRGSSGSSSISITIAPLDDRCPSVVVRHTLADEFSRVLTTATHCCR